MTSVSASFEVRDEGTAAQQLVQKAVGQGVLVHPVGGALATGGSSVTSSGFHSLYGSTSFSIVPCMTGVWAGNDLGSCEPTELQYRVSLLLRPNGT